MNVIGQGLTDGLLSQSQAADIVAAAAERIAPDGKRILLILPDHTRTCPLPMVTRLIHAALRGRARKLDFLVALGTHPPMSREQIERLLGVERGKLAEVFPGTEVINHRWNDPDALVKVGSLGAEQVRRLGGPDASGFAMDVDVTVNRLVFEYDALVVVGPVFPHEVAGFSGGAKYFFPGICGAELLNFFHWLGAVITNPKIIGNKHTPVRAVIEAAADLLRMEKFAFCMVVKGEDRSARPGEPAAQPGLAGLYFGLVRDAWSAAADLSDKLHITYVDRPFVSVLSRAPGMYDDLWTGGKCMYKLEPVVADGGELIIYAPHITEVSRTHGKVIEEIGYHVRDYFLADWERFKKYPWGVLAHSTHVRGIGKMVNGIERPRIQVTLATGITRAVCRKINLGHRRPDSIDAAYWENHEADGRLYVPKAGEMLYKLRNPPEWQ